MLSRWLTAKNFRESRQSSFKGRFTQPSLDTLEDRNLPSAVVNVIPEMPAGHEQGPTPAVLRFTRTGDLSSPLSVNYSLGGTAQLGSDYLVWEPTAYFVAGANQAFVTVLPRNDSLLEGQESVIVNLENGSGYAMGTNSTATVTIDDRYEAGHSGVFDHDDIAGNDLSYLQASISNDQLHIVVGFQQLPSWNDIYLYLDTDQDPNTGDIRPGYVGGAEYRLNVTVSHLGLPGLLPYQTSEFSLDSVDFWVHTLPTKCQIDYLGQLDLSEDISQGYSGSIQGNFVHLDVPLSEIGNPTAVDVFASSLADVARTHTSDGDRVPNYGAIDTATGQVVVRNPRATSILTVQDPAGDQQLGSDMVAVTFTAIADQFSTAIAFAHSVERGDPNFRNYSGLVLFDSDQSLSTGGLSMGGEIATWGGDRQIRFLGDNLMTQLVVQDGPEGTILFGGETNDGRWVCQGQTLQITGSFSLLDAYLVTSPMLIFDGDDITVERVPSDGQMTVQVKTDQYLTFKAGDSLGGWTQAIDSLTGEFLDPFTWDPAKTVSEDDPLEYGGAVSGDDLIRVDAQVIDNHLIVKGVLSSWLVTDGFNFFDIWLDVDADPSTGETVYNDGGSKFIGADYIMEVESGDTGLLTAYYAQLVEILTDGQTVVESHNAWLVPHLSTTLSIPGSFTVTIPLERLENVGPEIQVFVTTARGRGIGITDVAPPSPLVIPIVPPTSAVPDLVATVLDADSDHVLLGQTDVTFTVRNSGTSVSGPFDVHFVLSRDNWIGNGESGETIVVGSTVSFSGLAAGAEETRTIRLQLDRGTLFGWANADNPTGQGPGYASTETYTLGLVVDLNNDIDESNESNNSNQGLGQDMDDITYFPWDLDGNGQVTPLEALKCYQAIGTNDPACDFDGNHVVTLLEALGSIQRLGYIRNGSVLSSGSQAPSLGLAVPPSPVSRMFGRVGGPLEDMFASGPETPTTPRKTRKGKASSVTLPTEITGGKSVTQTDITLVTSVKTTGKEPSHWESAIDEVFSSPCLSNEDSPSETHGILLQKRLTR